MRIMKTTCIQLSNMMIAIDVRRELEGRSLLTTKIREKKQERFIPLILTLNVVATPSQLGFFIYYESAKTCFDCLAFVFFSMLLETPDVIPEF